MIWGFKSVEVIWTFERVGKKYRSLKYATQLQVVNK
jgi:hypothetical protein